MTILISIALLLIAINATLNSMDNRKIKKQLKDIKEQIKDETANEQESINRCT